MAGQESSMEWKPITTSYYASSLEVSTTSEHHHTGVQSMTHELSEFKLYATRSGGARL